MKNVKRFIALLMAVTLVFSLSVSVFAEALSTSAKYEFIVKVLDEEGNAVDSVKTGDKMYVAVYFQKVGDNTTTIDFERNASSQIQYSVDVPEGVFANSAELAGAYESAFNATAGDTKITDWVADTGCFTIWNTIAYSTVAGTVDPKVCIAKHEITAGAVGEYELVFFPDGTFAQSGTVPATAEMGSVSFAIVEGAAPNPTVGGTTAVATNGVANKDGSKIYDNAFAVSTTLAAVDTTSEIGVLFAPKAWLGDKALEATLDGVAKAYKSGIVNGVLTTIKTAAIKDIPRNLNDTEFVMVSRAYATDGTTYTYADAVETTVLFTKTAE